MRIISMGIPFSMLITGMNVFINTQGKTFIGMISVIIGAVINIVLDAVFILVMDMGVAGAAWATVIGQAVSAAWVVGYLISSRSVIRLRRCNLIPDRQTLGSIVALGISNFITTGAESLVNIILNHSLRKYGAAALSGFAIDGATLAISVGTIVTATSSFIRQPVNGFCQGLQPVISYNYGAGRQDRVRQAITCSIVITTVYAAVLWLLLMAVPGSFSKMFTESGEVIAVSKNLIRIYVFGMLFSGVQSTLIQSFIARGMKKQSLLVSAFSKCLYVPVLLILPALVKPAYSVLAIYGAQAITDVIGVLFIAILASVYKGLQ
ncbi:MULTISPECIES: MATE family efflux transporter [Clostridia]|uniref:MATE family efflux transporter n=1 Tax=Clostridia TaxID=186801 RepID=UPI0013791CC5|nr:MATE family efflux transporter [Clostridium sp. FS41]